MKVDLGTATYLVHWETRPFHPKYGNKELVLTETTCIVRKFNEDGNHTEISRHTVRQNYRDEPNGPFARKITLKECIDHLPKDQRTCFWDAYKESVRVAPMSDREKNRKLRERIAALEQELEDAKHEVEVKA